MAYEPTDWVDDAEPDLEAANLNKIEQGIKAAHAAAAAAQSTADGKVSTADFAAAIARIEALETPPGE